MSEHETTTRIRSVEETILLTERMVNRFQDGVHSMTFKRAGKEVPTLLQPGAQLLAAAHRLTWEYQYDARAVDHPGIPGHYEVWVTCKMSRDGVHVCDGLGYASSMESRHRYRSKYGESKKTENPDPADIINTVLKMASKRAFVYAVIQATLANMSQDIEDLAANGMDFERVHPNIAPKAKANGNPGKIGKQMYARLILRIKEVGLDPEAIIAEVRAEHPDLPKDVSDWPSATKDIIAEKVKVAQANPAPKPATKPEPKPEPNAADVPTDPPATEPESQVPPSDDEDLDRYLAAVDFSQ